MAGLVYNLGDMLNSDCSKRSILYKRTGKKMNKNPISIIQEQLNLLVSEHGYVAASVVVTDDEGNQLEINAADGLRGRWLAGLQFPENVVH